MKLMTNKNRYRRVTPRSLTYGMTVLCLFLLLQGSVQDARAGRTDKAGTSAAPELLIPVGAASIATAGSTIATVSTLDAMYWNPAGTAELNVPYSFLASHMNYFAGIGVEYFAGALRVEDLATFGLSAKILSIGEIPITTADHPDGTGMTTSPSFITIGGMVSRSITDHISCGFVAHYIVEKMENVSATGFAFTGGLQYKGIGGIEGLSLGVVVRNIGPALQYEGRGLSYNGVLDDMLQPSAPYLVEATSDDLPSTIEVGLAYTTEFLKETELTWASAFQNNNFSADEYKTGIEILFQNNITARCGYQVSSEGNTNGYLYGAAFGFGVHTVIENIGLQFDYCYRTVEYFNNNHIITLTVGKE